MYFVTIAILSVQHAPIDIRKWMSIFDRQCLLNEGNLYMLEI